MSNLEKRLMGKETREGKFSHIDPEVVIALHQSGVSISEIAKIYGCNYKTIETQMIRQGYDYDFRKRFERKDISVESVVKLRNEGFDPKEIARKLATSHGTIYNRLSKGGVSCLKKVLDIDESEVVRLHNEGVSKSEISRKLIGYVHIKKINEILQKHGVENKSSHYRTDVNEDDVCVKYEEYKSVKRVAKDFNVSRYVIDRILRERGYKIYSNNQSELVLPDKDILRMHQKEGKSGREIAEILGCSPTTIYNRLRTLKRRFKKHPTQRPPAIPDQEVRLQFKNGTSVYRLSINYGVSVSTIKKIVQDIIEERKDESQE